MPPERATRNRRAESARLGTLGPTIPPYAKQFVNLIQDLPQVKQVTLEYDDGIPLICTVIEAPRLEWEYSDPIYHAQGDVLRANPDLDADFRLINRTMGGGQIRDYGSNLPDGVIVLHKR